MTMIDSTLIIPSPPNKTFTPYQIKGIRYCLGARGTILADEMGLGKTVQAIGVINYVKPISVLIVCPKSLKLNWKYELEEWLVAVPGQRIEILTYGEAEHVEDRKWDLLILDEAHYIKNPQSKRSKCIKRISSNVYNDGKILLLTGTPMENCPIELWPLLQIACPETWDPPQKGSALTRVPNAKKTHPGEGSAFWSYAERYCDLKKVRFRKGNSYHSSWDFSGASNLQELNKRLRETCLVRRLKKDVLPELPEKRRKLITLKSKARPENELSLSFEDITEENYETLVKKLTTNKVLFEEYSKQRHQEALEKIDECIEIIEDALDSTEKIIIFAHHLDIIEKLYEGLSGPNTDNPDIAVKLTGSTSAEDRNLAVQRFQNDKTCRLFIGTIGAAGVGITLTAASLVIFVELDPVPGRMNQAEDRAHRMTQKNMVLVWHLLSNGSICARIAKILVKKQAVLSAALDE